MSVDRGAEYAKWLDGLYAKCNKKGSTKEFLKRQLSLVVAYVNGNIPAGKKLMQNDFYRKMTFNIVRERYEAHHGRKLEFEDFIIWSFKALFAYDADQVKNKVLVRCLNPSDPLSVIKDDFFCDFKQVQKEWRQVNAVVAAKTKRCPVEKD